MQKNVQEALPEVEKSYPIDLWQVYQRDIAISLRRIATALEVRNRK